MDSCCLAGYLLELERDDTDQHRNAHEAFSGRLPAGNATLPALGVTADWITNEKG